MVFSLDGLMEKETVKEGREVGKGDEGYGVGCMVQW